jgi:hypothetical protein
LVPCGVGDDLSVADTLSHFDGNRDPRIVRTVTRFDPRLRRHHLDRTRGVLRCWCLQRRPAGELRNRQWRHYGSSRSGCCWSPSWWSVATVDRGDFEQSEFCPLSRTEAPLRSAQSLPIRDGFAAVKIDIDIDPSVICVSDEIARQWKISVL